MSVWNQLVAAAAICGTMLFAQFDAQAEHLRIVNGLIGAQDRESKKLLALPPTAANQAATRDLLSILKPTGAFTVDNSHNVEGMTFVTSASQTTYPYVCRRDRLTLQYSSNGRFDKVGKWLDDRRQPVSVEVEHTYHIDQLPVPGFIPGSSFSMPICDARRPEATAAWFAAPNTEDAIRAANMFRMAEDEIKAGKLEPGPCDPHGAISCREWVLSLNDPSKITSIAPCTAKQDEVCYVVSLNGVDMTVAGTMAMDDAERITPKAITSVGVDTVLVISE